MAALLALGAGLVLVTSAQDGMDEMIADAMGAAPGSIARDATIVAYPDGPELNVLREGTNVWLCISSSPGAFAAGLRDPNCIDEVWQGWLEAFMAGETPQIDRIGISYMLAGDGGAGNVDVEQRRARASRRMTTALGGGSPARHSPASSPVFHTNRSGPLDGCTWVTTSPPKLSVPVRLPATSGTSPTPSASAWM